MDAQNTMPKREKNDISVKIWIPEGLYHALQDLAADRDQSLSEYIRKALEQHAFGAYHKISLQQARQDGRGRVVRTGALNCHG